MPSPERPAATFRNGVVQPQHRSPTPEMDVEDDELHLVREANDILRPYINLINVADYYLNRRKWVTLIPVGHTMVTEREREVIQALLDERIEELEAAIRRGTYADFLPADWPLDMPGEQVLTRRLEDHDDQDLHDRIWRLEAQKEVLGLYGKIWMAGMTFRVRKAIFTVVRGMLDRHIQLAEHWLINGVNVNETCPPLAGATVMTEDLAEQGLCCRICWMDYDVGDTWTRLSCAHRFHQHCIDHWFRDHYYAWPFRDGDAVVQLVPEEEAVQQSDQAFDERVSKLYARYGQPLDQER